MKTFDVLRNIYINIFVGLFSISNTATSLTGWTTSPPKLSLISHTINGDSIDVRTNSSLHLKCSGEKPMSWTLPNFNLVGLLFYFSNYLLTTIILSPLKFEDRQKPQINSLCDD